MQGNAWIQEGTAWDLELQSNIKLESEKEREQYYWELHYRRRNHRKAASKCIINMMSGTRRVCFGVWISLRCVFCSIDKVMYVHSVNISVIPVACQSFAFGFSDVNCCFFSPPLTWIVSEVFASLENVIQVRWMCCQKPHCPVNNPRKYNTGNITLETELWKTKS